MSLYASLYARERERVCVRVHTHTHTRAQSRTGGDTGETGEVGWLIGASVSLSMH
jgi:hypothetical protein